MVEEKRVTRLERFLRSRGIKPNEVEREASYSRQALLNARAARSEPRRSAIAAIVSALRRLTLEPVDAEDIFELTAEESGVWRERSRALRLRREERVRGEAFLQQLVRAAPNAWREIIATHPDECTAGLLRALILGAKRAMDRSPSLAAPLALLAATLDVPGLDDVHADHLRGCALLEYGNALRHAGMYSDALVALDRAEALLLRRITSANEIGQVWYTRAIVLWKRGDYAEARTWRQRASTLFGVLGDARRVAHVDVLEGGIRYEEGDLAAARDLWQRTLVPLAETADHRTLAQVHMNLATIEGRIGDADTAIASLAKAERIFKRLGVRPEMVRARWALGHVVGLHRSRARGLTLLRNAWDAFLTLKMPADAAFVGFDLVDVLLLDEKGAAEAASICHQMIPLFQRAGVNSGIAKAIAYLRDAVTQGAATRTLVHSVRTYVEDVQQDPAAVFAPEGR